MIFKTKPLQTLKMSFIFSLTVFLTILSCSSEDDKIFENTASSKDVHQELASKTVGLGNGVNLQPSYYNSGNVTIGWDLMKTYPGIETVRIEIEPDKVSQAQTWINEAHKNGFQVIATYHDANNLGVDDTSVLNSAASWWVQNYASLSSSGSITINLANEWGSHDISSSAYASAYNTAISTVRQVYSGTIIVDIPGWGQETHTAADASSSINDNNIAFSVHIYPSAYNQGGGHYLNTSDLDYLGNSGRDCIVGEFGSGNSGDADWSGLVDHAKSKGWTILGWCWNGDGGEMNMVTPSWATNATATSFSAGSYMNTIIDKLGGGTSTTPPDDTTPVGSGNITVKAKGVVGDEIMEIRINGSAVASYTLSTSYNEYSVEGNGTVQVVFTNDEGDRDVQVDYVIIDGTIYQAEDQEVNTGVWQDGDCGGSYSEWLHCGGYIEFNGSTTTNPDDTTTPPDDTSSGNCSDIQTWTASTVYSEAGIQVSYNGNIYENNWYSQNQNPEENSGQWQVWTLIGTCN